jgi:hypothetical protein
MKLVHNAKFFSTLFDLLKDVITEANIEFGEYVIRIQTMDPQKSTSVSVNLYGLQEYENHLGVLRFGIFVPYVYKLIRNAHDSTIISMTIEPDNPKIMTIDLARSKTEDPYSTVRLNSIELPLQEITEFNNADIAFSVPTKDLKRTIREMAHVSDEVVLTVIPNQVFLDAVGPMGSVRNEILDVKWLYHFTSPESTSIQKTLPVKYIDKFLNPRFQAVVDLWITKDGVLRLVYSFDCGTVGISLAPLT